MKANDVGYLLCVFSSTAALGSTRCSSIFFNRMGLLLLTFAMMKFSPRQQRVVRTA